MNDISIWEHDFCSLNKEDETHLFDYINESCLIDSDYYHQFTHTAPVQTELPTIHSKNNAEWYLQNIVYSFA